MRELLEKLAALERRVGDLERQERSVPVVAAYTTNAGQSIPTGGGMNTIVNFDTLVVDARGAVTTGAGWQFVAPAAGVYAVLARITFATSTTWAESEVARLRIFVNGAPGAVLGQENGRDFSASTQEMSAGGPATVVLAAGDALDLRAAQTSGGALALLNSHAFNHVAIFRIN